MDPLTSKYPHYTPYQFSGNKVIAWRELEGLEEYYSAESGEYLGQVGTSNEKRVLANSDRWDAYNRRLKIANSKFEKITKYLPGFPSVKDMEDDLVKYSEKLYSVDEDGEAFAIHDWGTEYLPKSGEQELATIIFEHQFKDKEGKSFTGLVLGAITSGPKGEDISFFGGVDLYIGGERLFKSNVREKEQNGWRAYSIIHTHSRGGKLSSSDAFSSLQEGLPVYMLLYHSNTLYYFDGPKYLKATGESIEYYQNINCAMVCDGYIIKSALSDSQGYILNFMNYKKAGFRTPYTPDIRYNK